MGAGRPTRDREKEIESKVFELRSKGFEASYIKSKTGFDKNTIYKYIKEYDDRILSDDKLSKSKIVTRILYDLDSQVDEMYSFCEEIRKEIATFTEKRKAVPKHLRYLELEAIRDIAKAKERKWNILGGPGGKHLKQDSPNGKDAKGK